MREHTLCSDDLGEVPEAERLDDMRLYGCGLLVYGIGAECGADHSARRPAALGRCHELCDCLGDIMWIWRIGWLKHCYKVLEHSGGNLAGWSVGCCPVRFGRLLNIRIHWGWIGARLD